MHLVVGVSGQKKATVVGEVGEGGVAMLRDETGSLEGSKESDACLKRPSGICSLFGLSELSCESGRKQVGRGRRKDCLNQSEGCVA